MDFKEDEELQEQNNKIENVSFVETTGEETNSNEEINENEPVQELDSSNSTQHEGEIKEVKGQMKKKAFAALVKSPIFWGAIGLGIIILLVVVSEHMDWDIVGVGNPKPKYYETPTCGKVFLTWEKESYTKKHSKDSDYKPITDPSLVDLTNEERFEYKEYEYNTYIAGIIWNDNDKALDVDNEVVYQAMAIAARSRLFANLPDNCVVLKYYNDQAVSFVELQGNEKKYTEINQAVQLSKGILIGRNNKPISAKYDAFSYTKKRKSEDEAFNEQYFYHMMNENKEGQQLIPAKWVEEIAEKRGSEFRHEVIKHVNETKKLESMSLYGAKYWLEKTDSQYDLYRILEEYYGRDIKYYTIDSAFSNEYNFSGCSAISMSSTSLSREEFIKWAENYGNSHGSGAKTLSDNAGMIYDMATSNGINPELVFVRADVEGYSPGSSKNNYWGLGCTNTGGYDACISYSSLSDGVAGFLSYISKYDSLTDLMSKYAYLGDYWYNPGSWGTGGCVYASAIYGSNIPERVREACAAGKTCTTAGGDDCVPTTDEDKQAYLEFQSQSMVSARQKIFGLSADICTPSANLGEPGSGNCTIYRQGDDRWGSIKLGSSNTNIASSGCAVTSVAIAISCSGVQINNVASFNPGTLVEKMNETGGFSGANIYWNNNAIKQFAPTFSFIKQVKMGDWSLESKINEVQNNLENNTSVLLHFENEQHPRGHYVVLKSISGTNFTVYDPGNGKINTYNANDLDGFVVYKY